MDYTIYDNTIKNWPARFNSSRYDMEMFVTRFEEWWNSNSRLHTNFGMVISKGDTNVRTNQHLCQTFYCHLKIINLDTRIGNNKPIISPVVALRKNEKGKLSICAWENFSDSYDRLVHPNMEQSLDTYNLTNGETKQIVQYFVENVGCRLLDELRAREKHRDEYIASME